MVLLQRIIKTWSHVFLEHSVVGFLWSITDVVNRVRNGESIPFRPQLPESSELGKQTLDLIRNCWQENPEHRPTFQQVRSTLRKTTNGESVFYIHFLSSAFFVDLEYRKVCLSEWRVFLLFIYLMIVKKTISHQPQEDWLFSLPIASCRLKLDYRIAVDFCRAIRCISAAYVVMRCLSVCHVRGSCENE